MHVIVKVNFLEASLCIMCVWSKDNMAAGQKLDWQANFIVASSFIMCIRTVPKGEKKFDD